MEVWTGIPKTSVKEYFKTAMLRKNSLFVIVKQTLVNVSIILLPVLVSTTI